MTTTTPAAVPSVPAAKASGRRWAYIGITLGGTVSIAANVAHSFIPPHDAPAGWQPQPGAVVGAIVWPVFLFIAIEILARTNWPQGVHWQILRWGGLLPVAAVAAFVSYRHLSGLLAFYGEDHLVVVLGPIAVDGLMAMATGALLAASHTTTAPAAPATSAAALSTVDTTVAATAPEPMPATVATVVDPVPAPAELPVPAHLVSTAQFAVTNHEAITGDTITPDELAARMSVSTDLAARLLALVELSAPKPPVTAGINGTHPIGMQP
jgi:hypothetical protein